MGSKFHIIFMYFFMLCLHFSICLGPNPIPAFLIQMMLQSIRCGQGICRRMPGCTESGVPLIMTSSMQLHNDEHDGEQKSALSSSSSTGPRGRPLVLRIEQYSYGDPKVRAVMIAGPLLSPLKCSHRMKPALATLSTGGKRPPTHAGCRRVPLL